MDTTNIDELKEKVDQWTFRYNIEEEMEALTMKENNHHWMCYN